jgi:hypothetical protein
MSRNVSEPLSNYGTRPTQVNKSDVPRLNEDALNKLASEIYLKGEPTISNDFEFPCNDDSRGVEDFSDWVYFKREQFHTPPINMKHSFTWHPDLLDKIRDQRKYKQFVPQETFTGYKETRTNLDRKKRAKRMLAIWKKSESTVRLMDGSKAVATAKDSGNPAVIEKSKKGIRSTSPPKAKAKKK